MTPSYNILFIFPLPLIPERGGIERVSDLLAKELRQRGHNIFYLHRPAKAGKPSGYAGYEPPASVHYLPQRKLSSAENRAFYHTFIREHNIHFIINQMGLSSNYCPFTNVPKNAEGFPQSISVLHNPPLLHYDYMAQMCGNPRSLLGRLGLALRRWRYKRNRVRELRAVARSSDCLCLLSPAFFAQLRDLQVLQGTTCQMVSISNPCAFTPVASLPPKNKQILYVGRLEPNQKAPQRLVPIWQKLCHQFPDWELTILGDGPYRKKLEEHMAGLPRVHIEGYRPPETYFRNAALACLTSTYEGFGLVLLEAMCHGTVPVAYNTFPVLGELLAGHTDQLAATPFDADDFAAKLAALMADDAKRTKLANAFIAKSAEYTVPAIADRWEALFAKLAGNA